MNMAGKMTNTETSTTVVEVESDIHIDAALVPRSVFVTGYKPTTKWEDLIIHFQKTRNGGGCIDSIAINKQGAAVITFDRPEVVKTVLQKKHVLGGMVLIVKAYEESMKMDDCDYKVFELVSAELCLETVGILTRGKTKTLLDEIAGKTGIKWIENCETFTMSGDFKQVELSRTYLQQAIHHSDGMAVFSLPKRKMTQPAKRDEDESQFGGNESDGVVKRVLQKKQGFRGMDLIVKPYEENMKMDNHRYEVFELVSAELCLETVEILSRGQTKTLLYKISDKTGIKWIEGSETFTMSGNFKQVELSRTYLQHAINQSGGIAVFSGLKGKMTQHQKHDKNESQFCDDESDGRLNQSSAVTIAVRIGVNRQDQGPNKTQSSHATSVTPPAIQNYEVEPKVMKVFFKAYETAVDEIEAEYHVVVPREAKRGKISLIPKDGCSGEEYDNACDRFIDLYQHMMAAMKMERFSLTSEKNILGVRKKIQEMSKKFPIFVETAKDQKHWKLFGENHHLEAALEFLRKEGIEIKRESDKDKGTGEFQVSHHDEEVIGVDPPDSFRGPQSKDTLETYIDSTTGGGGSSTECPICLDTVTNARTLKCNHVFCTDCVETALKHDNRCPVCQEVQGVMRGNQPAGQMQFHRRREHLPGYNAPRNPNMIDTKATIERKTEKAGLLNPSEILGEQLDSKTKKQSSDENKNWRQVQSDEAQISQALDEEIRARSIGKQELRQKETVLIKTLEGNLREEQQARTRVLEELSQAKTICNQLQERVQDKIVVIHQKEMIVDQLRKELGEQKQVRTWLEERLRALSQAHEQEIGALSQAHEQEIRMMGIAHIEHERLLEVERRQKTTLEERLRGKETIIDQLQSKLGEEQLARNRLEERLQAEMVSSQTYQQEIQSKENANREQQHLLEEERQQKTDLEERLRNLELQMQYERNRYLSNERELQSAVSAEYQRRQPHDWIIQREEVLLSESVLGKGAWGSVHQGTFRGCQVAVKVIHELILSPHNRRLFEREMSIASYCRHPNLLQFIGATNDDGNPLFVTEILDTTLRRLLSERALNDEEIVSLALDIAKGLNYLHLHRPLPIIHRDINSANVLLWRRDEGWRAKLSDYGSANFMRQCMTVNPGAIIYSAPEALTSQQSPKVDVYSFGLLLCEMCVRELPVPQEVRCQIGQVTNGALRGLIGQCVKRDPEERPTMNDIIYELEQLAQTKRM